MRAKSILLSSALLLSAAANAQVARNGFVEEFSSSTCPPCKAFNAKYDPVLVQENVNTTGVKYVVMRYQMNWPSPGNDASYNPHGLTRRTYYQVTSIPQHFVNGIESPLNSSSTAAAMQTELQGSDDNATNLEISGSYTVKGDSIFMSVTILPKANITGAHKLHIAVTDSHYENPGNTTGQLNYYHVMRKMFPSGAGTSLTNLTANTPQTFTFKDKYQVGSVTQNSFKFWNAPINGNLVAFVQNDVDTSIVQAIAIPAAWSTGVNDVLNISEVKVYPNPAVNNVNIDFTLANSANVAVNVFDEVGRLVYTKAGETLNAGKQIISVPTTGFASGNYYLRVESNEGSRVERFSIVK